MAKSKKKMRKQAEVLQERDYRKKMTVDAAGEPTLPDDDPDLIPADPEEQESETPDEPPPPGEGP